MKMRYFILSSFFICGSILSVDMNTSEAAKANLRDVISASNLRYTKFSNIIADQFSFNDFGPAIVTKKEGKQNSVLYGDYVGSGLVLNDSKSSNIHYDIFVKNGVSTAVYTGGYYNISIMNSSTPSSGYASNLIFTPNTFEDPSTVKNVLKLPTVNQHIFTEEVYYNPLFNSGSDPSKLSSDLLLYGIEADKVIFESFSNYTDSSASMFAYSNIGEVVLNNFKAPKNMTQMFYNASIDSLNLSNGDFSSAENLVGLFYNATVDHLDISNIDTSNVIRFGGMFEKSYIKDLKNTSLDTSSAKFMEKMFSESNIPGFDFSKFNNGSVSDFSFFFKGSKFKSLDLSNFYTSNAKNMYAMFYDMPELEFLDVSGLSTDNVTSMALMFNKIPKLKILDLSHFNTSSVSLMNSMFADSSSLTHLNIDGFNTENVSDFSFMFSNLKLLESLDVSRFNTQNAKNMKAMFSNNKKIRSLDVSKFNTKNVTDMSYMFNGLNSVDVLDTSSFDTSNVTDMSYMFSYANPLYIDLSNFTLSNNTSYNNMLLGTSFTTIKFNGGLTPLSKLVISSISPNDVYTGDWVNLYDLKDVLSPSEFAEYTFGNDQIQTWTKQRYDSDYDDILNYPKARTQGMLTFAQNKDIVDPINPSVLDPTKPDEDDLKNPEGGSGGSGFKNFYINYVTDFNFNDIKITGGDMDHFADPIEIDSKLLSPFVQVTDNRGVYDGWKLEVVPSEFKNDKDTLKGAELVITDGVITGNNGQSDEFKPQMGSSLKLIPGSTISIMSAEKDKGYGTWSLNFTDNEDGSFSNTGGVKAVIPVSALPKVGVTYTADFTWTLSATPE